VSPLRELAFEFPKARSALHYGYARVPTSRRRDVRVIARESLSELCPRLRTIITCGATITPRVRDIHLEYRAAEISLSWEPGLPAELRALRALNHARPRAHDSSLFNFARSRLAFAPGLEIRSPSDPANNVIRYWDAVRRRR